MSTAQKRNIIALYTIVSKESIRFLRIWQQTFLPPVIMTSLYFLIFGSLIGSRIGNMQGFNYIDFIVPGLIMMSVITNSYSNVSSSLFGAKFSRSIEEIQVSPMPNLIMLIGYVSGGVLRGCIVGAVVTLVSLFFSDLMIANIWVTIISVLITAISFSLAGFINGLLAKKFDDVAIVPTFVLTPLTYLGGVFYSVSLLPEPWQTISHFNPIVYMVSALRYGFLGTTDIPIVLSITVIILIMTTLAFACWMLLRAGIGFKK